MGESATLLSTLMTGIASGVMLVVGLVIWRSSLSPHVRFATLAFGISNAAWLVTESIPLSAALGPAQMVLLPIAYPVSALFWLFVLTVFDDRSVRPLALVPGALLLVTGPLLRITQPPMFDWIWAGRNTFGAVLALHALAVVVGGWRGDLVEGRRRFRALLLSAACVYVLALVAAAFAHRVDPKGPWLAITAGEAGGGAIVAGLGLMMGLMMLQARPATFGAARRPEAGSDSRVEAADRQLIEQLNALMAAEAWRREGLAIGDLAAELGTPEHRLRRLINQRLGHRNFADFLNGHRIEAARRRLGDPAEARTTVAAIAFDLGFGSLGPFNRAFREATGTTPTNWRRQALAETSPKLKEAS